MITQADIDQFYKDVEALKLKTPNASISAETKTSKGTVSLYLNKGDDPSENFLKKFYKAFGDSLKKVPRGASSSDAPGIPQIAAPPPAPDKYVQLMEEVIAGLKKDKTWLQGVIDANLIGLSDLSRTTLAYQKAWVEYISERDADPKNRKAVRARLDKLIAAKMGAGEQTGIAADGSN